MAAIVMPHHWLLPINCHFLRLYSAAGCGIAAVSSAIEESDFTFFTVKTRICKANVMRKYNNVMFVFSVGSLTEGKIDCKLCTKAYLVCLKKAT